MQPSSNTEHDCTSDLVNVAIAVIEYKSRYLLGFRDSKKFQGNQYEFVGGKIEVGETANQALFREIKEEIGLQLVDSNLVSKLGVIEHNYQKKISGSDVADNIKVRLNVYRIILLECQYQQLSNLKVGCENQSIMWVDHHDLVSCKYKLPDANKTILQWLRLPNTINITYDITDTEITDKLKFKLPTVFNSRFKPIAMPLNQSKKIALITKSSSDIIQVWHKSNLTKQKFSYVQFNSDEAITNWINFNIAKLPLHACVYIRIKSLCVNDEIKTIYSLLKCRLDLKVIISRKAASNMALIESNKTESELKHQVDSIIRSGQVIAQHLTQNDLYKLYNYSKDQSLLQNAYESSKTINTDYLNKLPLTVSCHSLKTIDIANQLTQLRLQNNVSPIIAMYISPVLSTKTHSEVTTLGWHGLKKLALKAHMPVIALGGISKDSLEIARGYSIDKIAGIRDFYNI